MHFVPLLLTLSALALLSYAQPQGSHNPRPRRPYKTPDLRNLPAPSLTVPTVPDEYAGIVYLRRAAPNHRTDNDPEDPSNSCSGAVILEHWVLFSAHCVQNPEEGSDYPDDPDDNNTESISFRKPSIMLPRHDDADIENVYWRSIPGEQIILGATSYEHFELDTPFEVLWTTSKQVGFRKELDELSFYDLALYRVNDGYRRKRYTWVARRDDIIETGQAVMVLYKDEKIFKTPIYITGQDLCRIKEMNALMYVCGCLNDTTLEVGLNDGPLYWHYIDPLPGHEGYYQPDALIGFIIRVMRREDGAGFTACGGKPAILFSRVDRWIRWIEAKTNRSIAVTRWRHDDGHTHISIENQWLRTCLRWLVASMMLLIIVLAVILGGSVV